MADTGPTIRFATEQDVPDILALIHELAEYEHEPAAVKATEESLLKTLSFPSSSSSRSSEQSFGPGYAKTLLIYPPSASTSAPNPSSNASASASASARPEEASASTSTSGSGSAAGFALFFHNYSTWRAAPGIYLEDLFVRPAFRGKGYGRALLARLAAETLRVEGQRLEWSVLKWNEPSIAFYKNCGARMMDEWVGMRVEGEEGLRRLSSM